MLQLRPYQRDALDQLYAYWQGENPGNGLLVLPTGAGKALVQAKLIEELLAEYPDMRIANVTHSATLVRQNFEEFIGLSPFAPAGLYSASLGRRDANAQILFCGIQSVANRTADLGAIDLVMIDEAHAISRDANTQYGKFFKGVMEMEPDCRRIGLTATAYRMDSGSLTEGEDRLFDDVVYEIGLGELMDQGYLTRLTSQPTRSKIDLTGINTRGGEYVPGQMSEAAELIIEAAIAEDMAASVGRRAGLFFCSGKANAVHARDAIRRHGRTAEALTSDTSPAEQREIIERFRSGALWAITSVNMIYTGANFPWVDFISLLFGTKSAGKLVQALGRGTRNFPGKTDCLVSDHGRNLAFFGPVDMIKPKPPSEGGGVQPQKLCPQDGQDVEGKTGCGELLAISIMTCPCCGWIFPPNEEEKITSKADNAPVLSTEKPWSVVAGRTYAMHPAKAEGKLPSVKATYELEGGRIVNEWLCADHAPGSFPKGKADRYWAMHRGKRPFPLSVDEFLERAGELLATTEVQLDYSKNPKYPEIAAYRVGEASYGTQVATPSAGAAEPGKKVGNLGRLAQVTRAVAVVDSGAAEKARLRALAVEMEDFIPF